MAICALFAKITILAVLWPLVSAAPCAEGKCVVNDETSLLQSQRTVMQGGKRSNDPDGGANEAEAFTANMKTGLEQTEPIEAATAARINFERELHHDRVVGKHESNQEIEEAKRSVAINYGNDVAKVDTARDEHNEAEKIAINKVNTARNEAIREGVEAHHVEEAAVDGRIKGVNDGMYNAHKQVERAENGVVEQHIARNHAEEAEARAIRNKVNTEAARQANNRVLEGVHDVAVHAHRVADATSKGMANEAAEAQHLYTHHIDAMNDIADAHAEAYNKHKIADSQHIGTLREGELP